MGVVIDYQPSIVKVAVKVIDATPHWACGKVNCDCDEQTNALMDEEARNDEYPADCY